MSLRTTSVAGSFYPADSDEIERFIKAFDEIKTEHFDGAVRAMIVPHAGYVYSGFTANLAFMQLREEHRRIIVIGPSHRVAFRGTSIALYDEYETPLGNLKIDLEYAKTLQSRFGLSFEEGVHQEHSTEVQMPFVKHYRSTASVIEMVYGDERPERLAEVIEALLEERDNLVVISTDLSHFYTEKEANELDVICLKAIEDKDPLFLHRGCEACGKIGVEALLIAAKKARLSSRVLDYRTSAWASNDTSRVVGYTSALFF